ncbi:MAG: ABC transporter ATP-binding protein [Bacilli bacterium]
MRSIELRNVSKSYNGNTFALKNLSVVIQPSEFFVLVGPSGCGKSTLLRMIAGLEVITEGVLLLDQEISNEKAPNERQLSMVFQNYALYPHMNVLNNVSFGLSQQKLTKKESRKRAEDACEIVNIHHLIDKLPRGLSGGQRQRVALSRSIASQMPICLMDEPLSNLDAKLRTRMRTELKILQQQLGMTVVYVTHDQMEAISMSDRMMILNDGIVQQVGDPLTIYNEPANTFVASFIGSPPMNLLPSNNETHILFEQILNNLSEKQRNQCKTIGIRPEHITVGTQNEKSIERKVISSEMLGTETIVSFEVIPNVIWQIRMNGQVRYSRDETIWCTLPTEFIHCFSSDGVRIEHERSKVEVGNF